MSPRKRVTQFLLVDSEKYEEEDEAKELVKKEELVKKINR